jgi:hypothetical protein
MIWPNYFLALFLAATSLGSAWERHVITPKGDSFDQPAAHPLSYFTRNPSLRDEDDNSCADCSAKGKAAVRAQHKFHTDLKKVGVLRGFAIYDLLYSFDDHATTGEVDWKSILVEISPGQFREIYHLQPTQAQIQPSYLLNAGSEQLLATHDLIPGTGSYYYEDYWWFGPEGPVRINIEYVGEVLKSFLPEEDAVWKGGGLDMEKLEFHNFVWKKGDSNCCPTGGKVDLGFRLEKGRLVLVKKHFDPAATPDN